MSFDRSAAGRSQRAAAAAAAAAVDQRRPAHFFLAAHTSSATTSGHAQPHHAALSARGQGQAAAASPSASSLLPSYVSLVRSPTALAKAAQLAAVSSASASSARHAHAGVLFPHIDDMDEEIVELLGHQKAMVAGAMAGVTEHVFMFPVDTIKTRMQALQATDGPRYTNVANTAARIIREEGFSRLYRGFTATVAGAIPSHAVHFATYEHVKHSFGGNEPGHHPVINGMAGGTATMAHDAIVTPLDVVKQRLQMRNSAYRGPLHCIRTVFAQEGLRAFYASYPTTVAMNVPFQAVHFAAYESFKILFTKDGEEHGILEDFAAGGAAGALAGCVSTPFDVVKTRLQTQVVAPGGQRQGARDMIRAIYAADGGRGFMRGATARMLYYVPSAAICWTTYEAAKRFLKDAW